MRVLNKLKLVKIYHFPVLIVMILGILLISCKTKERDTPPKTDTVQKPNIVFIVVDDLGWTDTGFNGSTYYETPNMNQMADEGINFKQAYAACAVCSPTRASIATGKYPARLQLTTHIPSMAVGWNKGVAPNNSEFIMEHPASKKQSHVRNRNYLPLEEVTIAEKLKEVGYATGYIGKWHLGDEAYHPINQGFDWQLGVTNFGQPMSYYAPYKRTHRGEKYEMKSLQKEMQDGEYLTDRLGTEAVHFIERHKDDPFFLQLAFYSVHTPIQPPKEKVSYFKEKPTSKNHKNPSYASMIQSVDDNIGKIINTLKTLGLEKNTMVILYSDNGGLLGITSNKPLRKGKGYAYEGGIRVPMLVKWPEAIQKKSVSQFPISSVDFLPTICAIAGVDSKTIKNLDGENLLPILTGESLNIDRDLFWHFPHYRGNDVVPYSIIRSGDWKLIKRYDGKTFELFNLKDDPSETKDMSDKLPEQVEQLNQKLEVWIKNTEALVPVLK